MLYTALGQGSVFLALCFFGLVAALVTEPLCMLARAKRNDNKARDRVAENKAKAGLNEAGGKTKTGGKVKSRACFALKLVCDLLTCLLCTGMFFAALIFANFGQFRVFCLVAFVIGFVSEKLILSKSVVFLISRGYTFCSKLLRRLVAKLCKKSKQASKITKPS